MGSLGVDLGPARLIFVLEWILVGLDLKWATI